MVHHDFAHHLFACHRGFRGFGRPPVDDNEEGFAEAAGREGRHSRGHDHGRHGHGGPLGGGPFGFGPPGGPWSFLRRMMHARARRGDIRSAILALLAEKAMNGYQMMQVIEERSRGVWRPSPGSVYPALQQLEDEGLVQAEASGGGRLFSLTEAGRKYVEEHRDQVAAPWEDMSGAAGDDMLELLDLTRQAGDAAMQVVHTGSATQIDEAKKVLADTRRALYRILAENKPGDEEG